MADSSGETPCGLTFEDFVHRWPIDGNQRIHFQEERALAYLLNEDVLFINSRPYIQNPWSKPEHREVSGSETIVVFVECNDLFAWGFSDAENISLWGGEGNDRVLG